MKVLSLTQPWATLVAVGAKCIETRSWETVYRGPLAIHASKGFPRWAKEFSREPPISVLLGPLYDFPTGVILCTVNLVACKRIVTDEHLFEDAGSSSAYRSPNEMHPPGGQEEIFGDYEHGRFGWFLQDVKQIEPIPAKGSLGLWNFPL